MAIGALSTTALKSRVCSLRSARSLLATSSRPCRSPLRARRCSQSAPAAANPPAIPAGRGAPSSAATAASPLAASTTPHGAAKNEKRDMALGDSSTLGPSLELDAQPIHAPVKRLTAYAQHGRSRRHHAAALDQNAFELDPFGIRPNAFARRRFRRASRRAAWARAALCQSQIRRRNPRRLAHQRRALNAIFELAHVARPL